MIKETREQRKERRYSEGYNNPKKDLWARRRNLRKQPKVKVELNKIATEDLAEKLDNEVLKVLKLKWYARLWNWIKSLFNI